MKFRLSLFIKAPVIAQVKTRLAASVGSQKALEIYKILVKKTLDNISNNNEIESELCVLGDIANRDIQMWSHDYHMAISQQRGDHLGERMAAAIDRSLKEGFSALLIGADCPELDTKFVREAAAALATADIVFGPVEDGGYCLVGMKQMCATVFEEIPWGTDTVLQDSITAAESAGLKVALLKTLWDVDTVDDWHRAVAANQGC